MSRKPATPATTSTARAALVGQLLDEQGAALALYAAQWTAEPDDCVQEALIELAGQPALPASPVAWMYLVVKRRALNHLRSAKRRRERERLSLRQRLIVGQSALPADETLALVELVDQLEPEMRETIVLRLWGGLSFAEIGEATETSTATAQRRYQQAISQLERRWRQPSAL